MPPISTVLRPSRSTFLSPLVHEADIPIQVLRELRLKRPSPQSSSNDKSSLKFQSSRILLLGISSEPSSLLLDLHPWGRYLSIPRSNIKSMGVRFSSTFSFRPSREYFIIFLNGIIPSSDRGQVAVQEPH